MDINLRRLLLGTTPPPPHLDPDPTTPLLQPQDPPPGAQGIVASPPGAGLELRHPPPPWARPRATGLPPPRSMPRRALGRRYSPGTPSLSPGRRADEICAAGIWHGRAEDGLVEPVGPMGQSGCRAGMTRKIVHRAVPGPPIRHDARHEKSIGPHSVGLYRVGPNRARVVLGPGGPFGIL
jgi:hypothetical protein